MNAVCNAQSFARELTLNSQGTRVHIYRWLRNAVARKNADAENLKTLPEIKTKEEWVKKIHPGEIRATPLALVIAVADSVFPHRRFVICRSPRICWP